MVVRYRFRSRWRFLRNATFIVKLSHLRLFLFFDNWKMLKGLFINYVKAWWGKRDDMRLTLSQPSHVCGRNFSIIIILHLSHLAPIYRRQSWLCNSGDWLFTAIQIRRFFYSFTEEKSQKAAAAGKCLLSGFRLLSQNRIFFSSPTLRLWSHRIAQGKQIVCLIWSWIESHELSIYMLFVFYVVEHFILVVLNPLPSPWWLGAL